MILVWLFEFEVVMFILYGEGDCFNVWNDLLKCIKYMEYSLLWLGFWFKLFWLSSFENCLGVLFLEWYMFVEGYLGYFVDICLYVWFYLDYKYIVWVFMID